MAGKSVIAQLMLSGLAIGSVYAVIALGFVILYKATRVMNFAQGELVMIGGYIFFVFSVAIGLPYIFAFLLALSFAFSLGITLEFVLFRRMVTRPIFSLIMITVGLASVFRSLAALIWGKMDMVVLPSPFPINPARVFGVSITYPQLATIGIMVITFALAIVFFRGSRMGTAMRAACDDQDAATLTGVNIYRVFQLAWIMTAVIACIGGIFVGHMNYLNPSMGFMAIRVFPAVILGGLESIPGAMLGGLIIGLAENMVGGLVKSELQDVTAYIVLILVLLARPYGFFGEKEIKRV